jgi:hypothetical protein
MQEILEATEKNKQIMKDMAGQSLEMVKTVIQNIISSMETNPIIGNMMVWEENTLLQRIFSSHSENIRDFMTQVVKLWQTQGIIIQEKPEVLAGAFRALIFMSYHKEGIGESNYLKSMELLIDALACKIMAQK